MLYLLPNLLSESASTSDWLPASVDRTVATLTHLIAENEKEGRLFLRRFAFESPKTFRDVTILLLNEHSTPQHKQELLEHIKQGGVWGLVSDCGMPCLADPGADLVLMARKAGVCIRALCGPSSPLLSLVLSGLGGQRFTFHGYLAKEEGALIKEIKQMELRSQKEDTTQLFIETPYRNQRMMQTLVQTLSEKAWLCVACQLTDNEEYVVTKQVFEWKKDGLPSLDKKPAIFLIKLF